MCVYVCMSMYIYMCTHILTCTHTHTHTHTPLTLSRTAPGLCADRSSSLHPCIPADSTDSAPAPPGRPSLCPDTWLWDSPSHQLPGAPAVTRSSAEKTEELGKILTQLPPHPLASSVPSR